MKQMSPRHRAVMGCLKDCKKCMDDTIDPDEDDDAMECYNDHLECMDEIKTDAKKMPNKKDYMKMFPKLALFKTCFGTLESCAAGADDVEVMKCAKTMLSCMSEGKEENWEDVKKLPKHIQNAIHRYNRCSKNGKNMPQCIRNHISAVKRMNYGYQVGACINKIFACRNKVDSDASECCKDFMGCKGAITQEAPKAMTEKEKKHPAAKKARAMEICVETFEAQHDKVPDEQCVDDFTSCVAKVDMPMVPPPMLKHGHCLRMLKKCSPTDAATAEVCLKDYHGCIGPKMMHMAMMMKDEEDDD